MIDAVVVGRDWNTPFRKALKPPRALQVLFSRSEMIEEPVLVYERGDTLDQVLARVEAIVPDPAAGRAQRDPVHPAIDPVAEDLARPTRILLTKLLDAGLLRVELIDLADAEEDEVADGSFVIQVRIVAPKPGARLGAKYRGRPAAREIDCYWPALLAAWPAHETYGAQRRSPRHSPRAGGHLRRHGAGAIGRIACAHDREPRRRAQQARRLLAGTARRARACSLSSTARPGIGKTTLLEALVERAGDRA